jgi:hypothetical protein
MAESSMQHTDDPKTLAVAYSKLKIEWAKNHINGVEQLVKAITSQNGHVIKPYQDSLSNPRGVNATIKQAFPQAEQFILDVVKPHEGADGNIWALNKIDNISKHRLLIPTTNIIEFKHDLTPAAKMAALSFSEAGSACKQEAQTLVSASPSRLKLTTMPNRSLM